MAKRRLHPIDVQRRKAFRAWIKWSPMLAVFFCVLFFDTWLSIKTRTNDYEFNDLRRQQRELQASLETLRVERAQLESMDRLAVNAPDLGLVTPEPHQVVAVHGGGGGHRGMPVAPPLITARVEWESMVGDVGMLLKSKVPAMGEPLWVVRDGASYLEESMEHLLVSF